MNSHSSKKFIIWTSILLVSAIIEFTFGPVEEYLLRLSPIAIWKLPEKAGYAIIATVLASMLAWVSAMLVGGLLGVFTAAGELAGRKDGKFWRSRHCMSYLWC